MYLIATGEPPFRDRQFDRGLICDIMGGLRPLMPDSAPEEYKKLAKRCCDADPDKRPDRRDIRNLSKAVKKDNSDDNTWNTIYHNDVKPLSRLEKESKYSSTLLPTGDLPKPRNSHDLDSAAGMAIGYVFILNNVLSIFSNNLPRQRRACTIYFGTFSTQAYMEQTLE